MCCLGTFASNATSAAQRAAEDDAVVSKVDAFAEWLGKDLRVAGANPWHYDDRPASSDFASQYVLGAKSLPRTMERLHALGRALLQRAGVRSVGETVA